MFHILCTSKCQRCKFSFSYTAHNGIHASEEHNYSGGLCITISKAHHLIVAFAKYGNFCDIL